MVTVKTALEVIKVSYNRGDPFADDVDVMVAIDYFNNTVSLVNYEVTEHTYHNKKYIFAECGSEKEELWIDVLDAQKVAIQEGMRLLKQWNKEHRKEEGF